MFYKSLLKPQIWTNAKNAQKWREGKTKHCSEKSIYFRDLVPIYFSGSLFSVFWLNLCKEGQFILHKCHMQLWENLCYWPSTITAKNYPFDAIVKHGVFVQKICKYTPPLSLGRTFSRLFSLQSQSTCFWVRYPPHPVLMDKYFIEQLVFDRWHVCQF